jgi:hypothetical protein
LIGNQPPGWGVDFDMPEREEAMRYLVAAVAVTAMLGGSFGVAQAQTVLDHKVQRAWDDLFDPGPPGDPRTNWERHRDAERATYGQRREAEQAEWCHYHPEAQSCGRDYRRY